MCDQTSEINTSTYKWAKNYILELVSDCCLTAIFQLYYVENKLICNEMMMRSALY
jgi:hypothetical protein